MSHDRWMRRTRVRAPRGACPIGEGLDRRVVNGEERGRERRRARDKAREGRRFGSRIDRVRVR